MSIARKPYPSDVSDDEWALVAPYLTLLPEAAGQREHPLREVFNGLRYIVKTGAPWRWMPHDLPPWAAVYQQAQRWLAAGCFEALAEDLRGVLRLAAGRNAQPSAVILDSRTLRSSPESGERAGGACPPAGQRPDRGRRQAQEGLQTAPGGGHAGPLAGPACDACQRRRSGRSRADVRGGAGGYRDERGAGLR
jgi:transposase